MIFLSEILKYLLKLLFTLSQPINCAADIFHCMVSSFRVFLFIQAFGKYTKSQDKQKNARFLIFLGPAITTIPQNDLNIILFLILAISKLKDQKSSSGGEIYRVIGRSENGKRAFKFDCPIKKHFPLIQSNDKRFLAILGMDFFINGRNCYI